MTLEIQEAQMLNDALLSAYTYQSLECMLYFQLGKQLQQIAPPADLQVVIFSVLTTAEREGWTDDLVHAAHDANPGNLKMKQFTDLYVRFRGAAPTLEKIIQTTNSFLDVAMWRRKLEGIERQVCSIEVAGDHFGTGFLIAHDLVLTNYHVIEDLLPAAPQYQPQQVRLRFDFMKSEDGTVLNDGVRYTLVDGDEWLVDYSPYSQAERDSDFDTPPSTDELDYAVLRVAPRAGADNGANTPGNEPIKGSSVSKRGWIAFPEQPASFVQDTPLFIVQHPDGKPLKMALASDSVIGLNGNGTRVRHKTNTEPGSSGSACFTSSWDLIALHHAGDPNWQKPQWNQAVPVSMIRNRWLQNDKLSLILGSASPALEEEIEEIEFSVDDEVDDLLQS